MWRNQGNTSDRPKRHRKPSPEKMALYIAESIRNKIDAGVEWRMSDYGIQDKLEMIKMVNENLETMSYYGKGK